MKARTLLLLLINALALCLSLAFQPTQYLLIFYCFSVLITLGLLYVGHISIGRLSLFGLSCCVAVVSIQHFILAHGQLPGTVITFTSIMGLFLALWVTFITYAVPLIRFPTPGGKYKVGVTTYHWQDAERIEKHASEPDAPRELLIQMWYPAYENTGTQGVYIPEVLKYAQKIVSEKVRIPAWILREFTYAIPHARHNAKLYKQDEPYPVILFSHGLGGVCSFNTAHIEELVSHGYIVVGVNHTYTSFVTHFPDGRVIPFVPEYKVSVASMLKNNLEQHIKKLEKEFVTWVEDGIFVLNMLEMLNTNNKDRFFNALDLDRIGTFGHSLGGALAAALCAQDDRVKAGVSLDGSILEETADKGFQKPFMFLVGVLLGSQVYPLEKKLVSLNMTKQQWDTAIGKYKQVIKKLCAHIGAHAYYITFDSAGHFTFTDLALLPSWLAKRITLDVGIISGPEVLKNTNKYLVDFFDKYIKEALL